MSTEAEGIFKVPDLDAEIRAVESSLPETIRIRPVADSIGDSASLIVTRLCVNLMYQKILCVLHRPYVLQRHDWCIQSCYNAASSIVRSILDTYKEFQLGGQFETQKWFMSTLTWHDFLLGAVAMSLVLCVTSELSRQSCIGDAEALILLQRVQVLCAEQSVSSKDTGKVQKLVEATLAKYGNERFEDLTNEPTMGNDLDVMLSEPVNEVAPTDNAGQTTYDAGNPSAVPSASIFNKDGYINESTVSSIDDISWTYLQQFLKWPSDAFTEDGSMW